MSPSDIGTLVRRSEGSPPEGPSVSCVASSGTISSGLDVISTGDDEGASVNVMPSLTGADGSTGATGVALGDDDDDASSTGESTKNVDGLSVMRVPTG